MTKTTITQTVLETTDEMLRASPIALPINALANLTALAATGLDSLLGGGVLDTVVHCCWLTGAVAALFVVRQTFRDIAPLEQ